MVLHTLKIGPLLILGDSTLYPRPFLWVSTLQYVQGPGLYTITPRAWPIQDAAACCTLVAIPCRDMTHNVEIDGH